MAGDPTPPPSSATDRPVADYWFPAPPLRPRILIFAVAIWTGQAGEMRPVVTAIFFALPRYFILFHDGNKNCNWKRSVQLAAPVGRATS
jgi:hypothetical protein